MAETASFNENFCIVWRIKNHLGVENLESDIFHLDGAQWKLTFGSNFVDYRKGYVFSLQKLHPAASFHEFNVKFFAEDRNRKRHLAHSGHLIALDRVPIEITQIWSEDLRKKNKELLVDKAVTFVFEFKCLKKSDIHYQLGDESGDKTVIVQNDECLESLSADFRSYLESGALSDATLKCGSKKIPAHRSVLAARSTVLSKILEKDIAEKRESVIKMAGMHPTVCNLFVQYIYTGKLSELTSETVPELYTAAEKYGIAPLKKRCLKFMKEYLTTRNACEYLAFAEAHKDIDLKEHVISFILKTEILQNDDVFLKFHEEHPKLGAELIHRAYKEKCATK